MKSNVIEVRNTRTHEITLFTTDCGDLRTIAWKLYGVKPANVLRQGMTYRAVIEKDKTTTFIDMISAKNDLHVAGLMSADRLAERTAESEAAEVLTIE